MKQARLTILILLTVLFMACQPEDDTTAEYFDGEPTGILPEENDSFHAEGRLIVDRSGTPHTIRGVAFGERHEAPLYLGEFGCIRQAFEGGRGGCVWVGDILDLCREKNLNYNYHAWHEINFGIWTNGADLPPADPDQPLIDLFVAKQKP